MTTFKTTLDILKDGDEITQTDLDDLVHDAASSMASDANNGGIEGQIHFLKNIAGWGDMEIAQAVNDKRAD